MTLVADVQWKLLPLGADVQWKLLPLGVDVQWKLLSLGADVQWKLLPLSADQASVSSLVLVDDRIPGSVYHYPWVGFGYVRVVELVEIVI